MKMVTTMTSIDLTPGVLYDHAPVSRKEVNGMILVDRFVQGRYRMLGTVVDARLNRREVLYQGVGGKDDGEMFHCTFSDFECRFVKVEDIVSKVGMMEDPVIVHVPVVRMPDPIPKMAGMGEVGSGC